MAARSDTDRGSETRALREIMLDHLSERFGKSSMQLAEDVQDDFGSCGVRRFHRQLNWLIRVGCVRRDREWDLEIGQWRPMYFRVTRRMPDSSGIPWCRECGLIGGTSRGHPNHRRIDRGGRPLNYMPPFKAPAAEKKAG